MDFESKCYWAARIFDNYNSSDNNANMSNEDYTPDYHNEANANDDNQFDFLFNNGSIRYFNHAGIVWFIGKDICDYLEYDAPRNAINEHVSPTNMMHFSYGDICKGLAEMQTASNQCSLDSYAISRNGALCITEQGVYELTRFSRMPKADKFYEWIHNRVLPSIRQTGVYSTPTARDQIWEDPGKILDINSDITRNEQYMRDYNNFINCLMRSYPEPKSETLPNGMTMTTYPSLVESYIANYPEELKTKARGWFEGYEAGSNGLSKVDTERKKAQRTVSKLREEKKELIAENEDLKRQVAEANRKNNPVNMCTIIPDDIRAKLSYEEFVALRDLSK